MGATANILSLYFNSLLLYYSGLNREHVCKFCTGFHGLYTGYARKPTWHCTRFAHENRSAHEWPQSSSSLLVVGVRTCAARELQDVGKPIRRLEAAALEALRVSIGDMRIHDMKRNKRVEYGNHRRVQKTKEAS
jgi:hypothetical protein